MPPWRHLSVVLLCFLAYGVTLRSASFIRDDWPIIAQNPLLLQRGGLPKLWSTGYWQAFQGRAATVDEWRPVAMLTHALDVALFEDRPGPMHLQNLLLHSLVCLLLFEALRRRHADDAAWVGACVFAVLPVHVEAVASLVGRAELLAAFWVIAAWLILNEDDAPRPRAFGAAAYALGMLSKEHAALFPALLAASDWVFHGRRPWDLKRRPAYAALAAAAAGVLILRWAAVGAALRVGGSYFEGVPVLPRLLTLARFWVDWYLWPSLAGFPLAFDFSRPLMPDAGASDVRAWVGLAGLSALGAWTARGFARRSASSFWIAGPSLFLLPTSHLLVPIDTLGAQRFLYLPTIAAAAAAAQGWSWARRNGLQRHAAAAAGLLVLFYSVRSARACRAWSDDLTYYEATVAFNPVSAGARLGLGNALRRRGDAKAAEREFRLAARLDPRLPVPHYDLGLMAWEAGRFREADAYFRASIERVSGFFPGLVMLGAVRARLGDDRRAEELFLRALSIQPDEASAHYNLGMLYLRKGRPAARRHLSAFVRLAPRDPDAGRVRALLSGAP